MSTTELVEVKDVVPTEKPKANIYQRMLKIQEDLGVVAKNITIQATKTSGYKAVSERDVIDAVKPLLAKYGVFAYPCRREIVSTETLENERVLQNGERLKQTSKFIRIETTFRFVNVADPNDFIEVTSYGDGIDTGDKSVGKAMTYSDKYCLLKSLLISTGDDPDAQKSPDEGYRTVQSSNAERKATEKQIDLVRRYYFDDEVLATYGLKRIEDLTMKQASDLITRRKNG